MLSKAIFRKSRPKSPTSVDETTFAVRGLTLPQANAVRADFLAYNTRTKDAHALLDNVLRDDPENMQARETMGFLSFSEGDIPAARDWYAQAVKLGSQSYLTHYYFASMSMRAINLSAEDAEAVEASLRKAIELNPSFAQSYDALATLYGRQRERLDEAHMLNVKAVALDPSNLAYRLNAANILLEEDKQADAISVLQLALAIAKAPQDREEVEGRLQAVQRYEQAQQATTQSAKQATTRTAQGIQNNAGGANHASMNGKIVIPENATHEIAKHPDETPHGPTREFTGTVEGAACSYPTVLELKIAGAAKTLSLYSNNFTRSISVPPTLRQRETSIPAGIRLASRRASSTRRPPTRRRTDRLFPWFSASKTSLAAESGRALNNPGPAVTQCLTACPAFPCASAHGELPVADRRSRVPALAGPRVPAHWP
jgi:tetratricopeptide (TPR) repeat protein